MTSNEEWKHYKLERLQNLRGMTFELAEYEPPSTDWDHDHCEGCWAKFATFGAPEIQRKGYFVVSAVSHEPTQEPEFIKRARESGQSVMAKPDNKKWICQECFEEFREFLKWKVKSSTHT
jgi:hypothetical protein